MIFAFSGTGNSSYVARRIAEVTGHQVRSINDALAGRGLAAMPASPMEPLVFVAPTYAWQLPHVVRDWIERSDFGGKAKTSSRPLVFWVNPTITHIESTSKNVCAALVLLIRTNAALRGAT